MDLSLAPGYLYDFFVVPVIRPDLGSAAVATLAAIAMYAMSYLYVSAEEISQEIMGVPVLLFTYIYFHNYGITRQRPSKSYEQSSLSASALGSCPHCMCIIFNINSMNSQTC